MIKDKALRLALEALEQWNTPLYKRGTIINAIKKALETKDELVSMRMPKVGDRVVCIEDESLGVVHYLTGGGSPEIKFDDGSHGTFLLRDFAELFGYADTTSQPKQEQGEPVAWATDDMAYRPNGLPLYTTPQLQTKDEPKCVAIVEVFEKDWRIDYMSLPVGKHKLYAQHYTYTTTPQPETKDEPVVWEQFHEHMAGPNYVAPQRTWVGLTNDDMSFLFPHGKSVWVQEIVKIIENKLKERNT